MLAAIVRRKVHAAPLKAGVPAIGERVRCRALGLCWRSPILLLGWLFWACLPAPAAALTAQTITFANPGGKTYGVAPFAVSATASSGLTVSFASTTTPVCTVSGTTVTIIASGTCTIQASQAGNATYAAAPNVNQSFTIAKAAQTITFGALTGKTYGNAPFTVSATATSGLAVAFVSTTTAVCTVSAATVTIIIAGTCTIQAQQAGNGNYNAAPNVNQSFTIAKAAQTITFANPGGKTYGTAPFTVSATASSGLTVSFVSTTTAICTVSVTTVTIVAAGTCTLRAQQAGNGNYNAATSVSQTLTVAKATQTITFGAMTGLRFDQTPAPLSATASSGLTVAFTSTTATICTVSGTAITLKAAGTCTIAANQAGNTNYLAATAVSRSFSVAKGNQTITFGALGGKAYKDPAFTVSATASSALAVTFTSTTTAICTISGSTVTLKAVGTCTIQAVQAGNTNWSAAPNVPQSFTITQGSQTITFNALPNKRMGSAPFSVSASSSSGLAVAFVSLTNAICTVTGSTVSLVALGTCTLQASQLGNANYLAAPNVNQSFLVTSPPTAVSFSPQVPYATWSSPKAAAMGDFNGDGKLDVAVANDNSATFSILLGNGDGTFPTRLDASGIFAPGGLTSGDFNGDGLLDLAVTDLQGNQVTVYVGGGDGTFAISATMSAGAAPSGIVTGDFNGDGVLDLAVTNQSLDSNVGTSIIVFLGYGDGTFDSGTTYVVGTNPVGIAAADVNSDGKLDLIVANVGSNNTSILLGNGDGTFHAPTNLAAHSSPVAVAIGDVNADGKPDLILALVSGEIAISLGNGNGTFATPVYYTAGTSPTSIALGDFDGDSILDISVANSVENNATVYLGNGDGSLQLPVTFATGASPAQVVIGDFSNDGKLDLAVLNYSGATVSVLLNTTPLPIPASLSIQSGNPQAAGVGTRFATAMTVLIRDASNNPLPGVTVTFCAPPLGASGAFPAGKKVAQVTTGPAGTAAAPVFSANGFGGTYAVTAKVLGLNSAFALTNTVPAGSPVFTSAPPPNGMYQQAYSYTIAASGTPKAVFSIFNGDLPPGLTLNGTTGVISGTPTDVGVFSGMFVADSGGTNPEATQAFSIAIAVSSQTITFGSLSARPITTPPFTVSATASSGLPVTFATLTPSICSVSGVTVTLVATGSCTIRAAQSGNVDYGAAANVDRTLAVTNATQTIAFNPLTDRPLGGAPVSAIAVASSGLPVAFSSLTPTTCSVTGNTITLLAAGTCSIQANQSGNQVYAAATSVTQSFVVLAPTVQIYYDAVGNVIRIQRN